MSAAPFHVEDRPGRLLGEDKDMLEDLVMAAFNDAVAKAQAATQAKMAGFTAGMNLPPGMGLPF